MTHRGLISLLVAAGFGAAPSSALAGAGFTVPSHNTYCGLLTASQGGAAGLYCESNYVSTGPGMGGAKLLHSGKGRKISIGNDLSLLISNSGNRSTLGYGKTWKRSGYTCVSRSTGLTCRRGSHGFFLSRESQRYF